MLFFKNNEIPDVAESCFRVSYCKLLFLSINSSAGLSGTTTQRPRLWPKVHAVTASTALCCTVRRQSFISLQCKAQLQPHIFVHITTSGLVNPQGRPVVPARGTPAPCPRRGCRRCRRGGRCLAPAAGQLCAELPLPRLHPSARGRERLRYSERERRSGGAGRGPAGGIAGRGSCHGGEQAPGRAQEPALPARPGREGGRRVEETPPAFIARTAPGCAGSRRRRGALSGDSDSQEPSLSYPSRLCPVGDAPGLQPGPASPQVHSVLSALLPAAAPDLVQPGAGASNKPCPL